MSPSLRRAVLFERTGAGANPPPPPPPPPPSGVIPGIGIWQVNGVMGSFSNISKYMLVIGGPYSGDLTVTEGAAGRGVVYVNATVCSQSVNYGISYTQALNNGWLLKDSAGNYLINPSFNTYGLDIGNTAMQQAWINYWLNWLAARPSIDGIFIDAVVMDPKATFGTYPAKYPDTASYSAAMVSCMTAIYSAMKANGHYMCCNTQAYKSGDSAYGDGTSTINWWQRIGPHTDGMMNEYYAETSDGNATLRSTGTAWYQEWAGWQRLISTAEGLGKDFIGLLYGADSTHRIYGKASFLLEWNGINNSVFQFHNGSTDPWNADWTTDIGTPTGAKVAIGVGYMRTYTGGHVLVNPHPTTSQTFTVNGVNYTLTPITGRILVG